MAAVFGSCIPFIRLRAFLCVTMALGTSAVDTFMVAVTAIGNAGAVWILLGILLLAFKKHRKTGIILLAALLIDFAVCNIYLKNHRDDLGSRISSERRAGYLRERNMREGQL